MFIFEHKPIECSADFFGPCGVHLLDKQEEKNLKTSADKIRLDVFFYLRERKRERRKKNNQHN